MLCSFPKDIVRFKTTNLSIIDSWKIFAFYFKLEYSTLHYLLANLVLFDAALS